MKSKTNVPKYTFQKNKNAYPKSARVLFKVFGFLFSAFAILFLQIKMDENRIVVDAFTLENSNLPEAFEGTKIVHLSDLHGVSFKDGQKTLMAKVLAQSPDFVVVSGDTLDRVHGDWLESLTLLEGLSKQVPVYVVTGNHDIWTAHLPLTLERLRATGATVLENESVKLSKIDPKTQKEVSIRLFGIHDPCYFASHDDFSQTLVDMKQKALAIDGVELYSLLISHRPERQHEYTNANYQVTFSGHAHGGQVRLPFTQGLIAPNQGFFPKLTAGVHEEEAHYLVISRGLGNPHVVPRVFNPPEIVSVTLSR